VVASTLSLAVDVMGGDDGVAVTLPAVFESLAEHEQLNVQLFGSVSVFEQPDVVARLARWRNRVRVIPCADDVAMDDQPALALRNRKDSSMYRAVLAVSRGEAQACVSAGNSGALMMIGKRVLKTFTGVDRPALCATMPTLTGSCLMLDLGANVDCRPQHLVQFAVMGSEMAKAVLGIARPRVALLNIGEEEGKGNILVRETNELLSQQQNIHYIGYAEGNDIYRGTADVIVCDGFVGNAVLKASEGVATLIASRIRQSLAGLSLPKDNASMQAGLKAMLGQINPAQYNGATFLGLNGVVVASHGRTDKSGFAQAIRLAVQQVTLGLTDKIQQQLVNAPLAQ